MELLDKGYYKPNQNDKGSVFFPALEANFQRLNDHNHDGINSEQLSSANVSSLTQHLEIADWQHVGGGTYRQLVQVPAGIVIGDCHIAFFLNDGSPAMLSVQTQSDYSFYVFINDPSQAVKVVYAT